MIIEKYNNISELPEIFCADLRQAQENFFGDVDWYDLLQKHITGPDEKIIYYCILDQRKKIQAVFPLVKSPGKATSGYALKSLANFYTMEYIPPITNGPRKSRKVINAFVNYLFHEEKGWVSLDIFPLDETKLEVIYLREKLAMHFPITSSLCHKNWIYINNNKNFDDYIACSPPRIKDIRREERRVLKQHEVDFRMYIDDENMENAIQDYFTVYDNSWKEKENYPEFIPDLIRLCAQKNMLRLGILYIDGIASAAQLNIFHDNITLIYKLSYQEQYKNLSAGAILSFKMMQYAFSQDNSRLIDYGCGNDEYKKNWMNHCLRKTTLTAYNNNIPGKYLFFKRSWKARIKQLLIPTETL